MSNVAMVRIGVAREPREQGGGECDAAARYIGEQREWMRYDACLAHGLPIDSGRAEAACKMIVGRRLGTACVDPGRRESRAVGVLRARTSGWFDDCWDEPSGRRRDG